MEISFQDTSIRTICEREDRARRCLGREVAAVLKHRIADLWAATSIADLVVGNPREMTQADGSTMCMDLCCGYQLIFCANHVRNPLLKCDKVDWSRVSRIKILRIERTNA